MKKYLIKTFLLIIIIFTLLSTLFYTVYADDINLDITSKDFSDEFKPGKSDSGTTDALSSPFINTITQVVNPVLGLIQMIGAILSVVSIALFGITMVLSSTGIASSLFNMHDENPDAKAKMMKYFQYLVIGSILLTASVTFVRIVFDLLMGE